MAKRSKEDVKALLTSTKEELNVAKGEKRTFEKENKLAKDTDHSEDAKHGKRWAKLASLVTKKEEAVGKLREELEGLKVEKTARVSTYEYPKDVVTAGDKKKFRAAARAAAKRAEKEKDAPKKEKKVKSAGAEKEVEAPKKKKKSAEVAED